MLSPCPYENRLGGNENPYKQLDAMKKAIELVVVKTRGVRMNGDPRASKECSDAAPDYAEK